MTLQATTLAGPAVRLEPLGYQHASDLLSAGGHEEIWTYLDEPTPHAIGDINDFIRDALAEQSAGERLPFAVVDANAPRAIGSISYIDIQPEHRGLEIGWAWLAPDYWGRGTIVETSYLLLEHAFESLGMVRVAVKADARNQRSRRAIVALGATQEGIFRKHRILSDGYARDSVYFSVVDAEWPAVRKQLRQRIGLPE